MFWWAKQQFLRRRQKQNAIPLGIHVENFQNRNGLGEALIG